MRSTSQQATATREPPVASGETRREHFQLKVRVYDLAVKQRLSRLLKTYEPEEQKLQTWVVSAILDKLEREEAVRLKQDGELEGALS